MSFAERLKKSRNNTLCLIVAPVGAGRNAWYFIRVAPAKFERFRKLVFEMALDLAEYGEILRSGFGDYPPQSVIDEMIRDHGYDPQG